MHKTETGQIVFENDWEVADYVAEKIRHAEMWERTSERLQDCHTYTQKHMPLDCWGKNVFHIVLDDAIEMRKVFEPKLHRFDGDNICLKCGLEKANTGRYCENG